MKLPWLAVVGALTLLLTLRSTKSWAVPEKGQQYAAAFAAAEAKHGLPHNLLARMAQQESSFDPDAVSHAGAVGLMQIVPRWHPDADPYDPLAAIDYAGSYMRRLFDRFGSWHLALAAYNWGPTALSRDGLERAPKETRNYVMAISADVGLI